MITQVIWTSMVDCPNHVCSVLFFGECNFECKFCYNKELVKMKTIDFDKEILPKLIERKDFIQHIILSGGECTCSNEFTDIVQKLYMEGFKVGIHTNGSNPDVVEKNIEEISFLGIDFKTSREKYSSICNVEVNVDDIIKTIKLAMDNNKEFQVRTTMFPPEVKKEDCIKIAKLLKELGVKDYTLQQYQHVGSATIEEQYTQEELIDIKEECEKIIYTNLKVK